jgi:DNA modification methylase
MKINYTDLNLSIQYVEIEKLKPFDKNPRTHSKEQIVQIANSIQKFGFINPILVDENFEIIAGHGRILASKELGLDKVPVAQLSHLTHAEKRALLIADNRIAENAGWDDELLAEIMAELHNDKFDLSLLGFSNKELEELRADFDSENQISDTIDDVPDIPITPVSKKGDLWILGEHRLLCGDALSSDDLTRVMNGEIATMTFTDPPYNIDYQGSASDRKKEGGAKRGILNDKLGTGFYAFLETALKNILSHTLGSSYICMGGSELHTLYEAFAAAGGRFETYIVWVKNKFSLTRARYQHQSEWIMFGDSAIGEEPPYKEQHEEVFVGRKNTPGEVPWYGGRNQTDVWNFDRPNKNDLHPTMKPVALIERAIHNSSKAMDIVLDPFGGSGSTLIACEKTNRRCRMIELDEKYVDIIIGRWQEFTDQIARHESGKTFTEIQAERA